MKEALLELILPCVRDASKQLSNKKTGINSFNKYKKLVITHSSIYDNHLGTNNTFESLKERFVLETVILNLIAHIGNLSGTISRQNSPVDKPGSLYSWYKLPDSLVFDKVLSEIKETNNPETTIIDACHQVLSELAGRHIGEYYTPIVLAEHLIGVSNIKPNKIFDGINIVDPACGGGVILVRVAQMFLEYSVKNKRNIRLATKIIQNTIYGFDIQPFAIALTKTMLAWVVGKYLIKSKINFPNIQLIDPLTQVDKFWKTPNFDYVISNPPFMVIKKNSNGFLSNFSDIAYGHPNLYAMFLWWAIKSTKTSGYISLLIPQSMLAGAYYEKLRSSISSEAQLRSITKLLDRKGAIKQADQQMMVVAFEKGQQKNNPRNILVKVAKKSLDVSKAELAEIPHNQVVRGKAFSNIWVVSDEMLDYQIEEAVCNQSKTLGLISEFKIGNGGYVWNQNKEYLTDRFEPNYVPLISSASIASYVFAFPHNSTHSSKTRSFSKLAPSLKKDLKSGSLLLIQRTTPRKLGRRLIGCLIDNDFTKKYKTFFVENHVNYIATEKNNEFSLFGLLGWLNSDLANFIFQMRNGSTQVSIFELSIMPVKLALVKELESLAKLASTGSAKKREATIKEINSTIYRDIGITIKQQKRIEQVLNWKD